MKLEKQLRDLYGWDFPDEVFDVWDLARRIAPKDPRRAFWADDAMGVSRVGPFDVIAGLKKKPKHDMRLHWRFTMDPPELFTLMRGDTDACTLVIHHF
jgi:hypothetical protein